MAEETGGLPPQRQSIIPINIEDEMRGAYIDYSMSVIVSRALPDVRDGSNPFTAECCMECRNSASTTTSRIRNQPGSSGRFWVSITHTEILLFTRPW
jgi:hypothetical protein